MEGTNKRLLVLFALCLFLTVIDAVKVSFYGASHIAMPLQESKISTNIRLRFRSRQDNALILLTAGRTDYSLLSIDGGRIRFSFKIDEYQTDLWSPVTLKFNDLQWHDISISRYAANLTMQIDEYFTTKTLPEEVTELNVHFGVFIGGVGEYSATYLGTSENFRGCIADIFYNNINIFKRARERTGHVTNERVSWICAPEFDADVATPISFLDDESYVILQKPTSRTGDRWSMEFRTNEPFGMLLSNIPTSARYDFMALEIVESQVRLLVGKGSNAVELIPDRNVSDGKWHNISLSYSPMLVDIMVDDVVNSATFANGSSQMIELEEEFYIGGFDSRKKRKAFLKGARSTESSLKGCIRNMVSDDHAVGFPNYKVTHGITVDCVWRYPCIEKQPCIPTGHCHHQGINDFICYCDQAYCIKADYPESFKIFSRAEQVIHKELMMINPMDVLEGGITFLSPKCIEVLFDFTKSGIQEAGIIFHIIQPPKHGRVTIHSYGTEGNASATQMKFFSHIDLTTDKVKYTHDGAEHPSDHMTIDMQLVSATRNALPKYLEGKHRFVLHVNVTPVNDPPVLRLPSNKLLRVTQGIPKVIGSDFLQADDPDSPPDTLIYTILMSPNSEAQQDRVELNGRAVATFSQSDVNAGLVTYLINSRGAEDTSFELNIQVSDGMETSPANSIRVSVLPLQLRMMNNTGLVLIHKSSSLITPYNLSFVPNSDDENVDMRFDVVQPPVYGSLQKLRSVDSSWISVDSFSSNQLLLGQIRYLHSSDLPLHDEFKFTVTLGPVTTSTYDFRISFTKLRIGIVRQNNMYINTKDNTIRADYLFHQTSPIPTYARNIIYTVVIPPKFGIIYVDGHPEYAKPGDSFTQQEVDKNLIKYRTYQSSYGNFIDTFEFIVSVPECDDVQGKLDFIYSPPNTLSKQIIYQKREKLYVHEGNKTALSRTNFEVLFNKFSYLTFNLTHYPKHGGLCKVNPRTHEAREIFSFTLQYLYLGDIYYCHDDSESKEDSFRLLILSDNETDFQFVCEIQVEITLLNDNGPYRVFDKVFHIVRDENKLLTSADLKYADPDIETRRTDLEYRSVGCTNGELLKNGKIVELFNQDDLDSDRLLFQHNGTDHGKLSFIVTDGLYEVPGAMEIEASDPFLKIRESNASIVQEGRAVLLTLSELNVDTNLNAKPEEIEYRVINEPSNGLLKLFRAKFNATQLHKISNASTIMNFSQADILGERLVYWNREVASMDKIKYRVVTKGVWAEGEIMVRIYPPAYWEPLRIRRNQTLFVEESTSVIISRDILEIVHPNISPGDITYLVTTQPQHGYLEIQSITSDDEYNSKVFDQSTINSEKMFYIQAGVNQSSDYFTFDVTNGITWLRDLIMRIVIIPEHLYIKTNTIVVEEGKTVKIQPSDITSYSEYYNGKILEYKILEHPLHGSIKSGKSSKVNRFTQKQLEGGVITYVHNGSENSSDTIRLVALGRNKESVPFNLNIQILPVNDEVPQVVTNTGMHMWIGGKSMIQSSDLMVQDYDTPPENLTYNVQHMSGGYVALKDAYNKKVHTFTQQSINENLVYFIHDSSNQNGRIMFYVSDGVHNTTEHVFHIVTNPVALELVKNEVLHVFPLTRKQILPEQLYYKCSDDDRDVKFVVTVPPQMGRLVFEHQEFSYTNEISEFRQHDVENGRIFYEHTHPMVELKTNDSFFFDVTAPLSNSLVDQVFNIDVSVSSGGLLRFLPVPRINLDEGESAPIKLDLSKVLEYLETRAGIQNPELYIEVFPPAHGIVELEDSIPGMNRFTLNDFYVNRVIYKHDHSDTVEDKIALAVILVPGHLFLCNITIPVTINPVNDQPFHLVTVSPHISVIEGENQTITSSHLLTEDADTVPKDIVYDVITGPNLGVLLKISDEGYPQDIITYGNQFSQADINENRIIYTHSGNPQSTTFYFKVSDGKFKPAYEIFNVKILPITILPGFNSQPIMVQQGTNLGLLETKHVSVETNVQKTRIVYNITKNPMGGIIISNNKPVLKFTQRQLEDGKINYMQTDMTRSNDSFQLDAYIPDTTSACLIEVNMIVQPFIIINPITITPGERIRLSSTFIFDNPAQLKLNRYNPKITITRRPKYGRLRKIVRSTGLDYIEQPSDKDISNFTYKELKSGVIYYVARKFNQDFQSINDNFEYVLATKTAQPGQGTVPIEIYSPSRNAHDSNDVDIVTAESNLPFDYLIIACIAAAVIVILLMIIVLLKCRSNGSQKDHPDKDHPPSLPRPPDFMTLNNRMYTPSENESLPVTSASTPLPIISSIPHCKVIPIGLDNALQLDSEPEEDMMDMHGELMQNPNSLNYPYGDEGDGWSSSCDIGPEVNYSTVAHQTPQQQHAQQQQQLLPQQSQKANPLLRRNQYWV
ncbi:chondroitin sulfate proteoglycan 4 [Toxorhynchites rutilus septentrionalis]|uniref:chondroitin sulfate proteoglycan 4 n=1 Tax=Toxorhynchites rutilus septentrionalis TaxID=329112 RepID=UPI00247A948F|nr:chondroitin sulfate proteoglycan 4 [Toxorhynchites rutilus septentrionalis]XP_055645018.1 chondroitin sulfate proteoglycan 4 [Toxorhynchites rutilus septentrionalis]XP_055645019.1 chondroitin sulfate proteoglycan 4 [Toxorhynchites rutilus septentrionalis]XP_055645020.1 chondroitin sulfate proteoglycan 4 [Toxorhynchites rutilus septentrionalis]XP_055645021.1 chondroitin sulfate proteoglycan 4 [Toxorhynchites rutilus septentrionalis]XP_055645022.1 chondroitin sulfate proteoglycan 4 [Toxorhync